MSIPENLKYSEDHEWTRLDGDFVYIGITDYAQGELGDVVYVDLPSTGDTFGPGDVFGSIEAVKAASDLYCPVGGEVVEVNEDLADTPETINSDPYGAGWMVKLKLADPSDLDNLLDAKGYEAHIGE